jgi:hypothetical protein
LVLSEFFLNILGRKILPFIKQWNQRENSILLTFKVICVVGIIKNYVRVEALQA